MDMTSFQDAPDEATENDEVMETRSRRSGQPIRIIASVSQSCLIVSNCGVTIKVNKLLLLEGGIISVRRFQI